MEQQTIPADGKSPETAGVLEHLVDGIVVFDAALNCRLVNPAAAQLYAQPREQLLGRSLWNVLPPLEGSDWHALLRGCIEQSAPAQFDARHPVLERWFDVQLQPLPEGGLLVALHEITGRRRVEDILHERMRQFSEAERRKGDMLATLAHELRNPLAPLRNAIEVLGRPELDGSARQRMHALMSRQIDHLVRLIEELSDISRMTTADVGPALPPARDGYERGLDGQGVLPLATDHDGAAHAVYRVLVADDNDLVRESFVELLAGEGYEVRTAADGEQAVAIAADWHPDVVLLDIHMPRLSGIETARRLREAHPHEAMTLLMMSGMTLNEAWIRHAKAAGFDDCVDKTSDPQSWLPRLRGVPAH